ncbi:WYL domain-containing protein [bacterium]|nr:WYL domain-containing protein [bacterium]
MNELKKTDFNFNYICLTAYRALLLLKFLSVRNLTRQNIIDLFKKDEFIYNEITEEVIRSMINTLKNVGCEITRPAHGNNYEYRLIKTPFSLSLNPQEIKLINKFRKKTILKNGWQNIINTNLLIDKICLAINDEEIKDNLKSNGLLTGERINLIKRINECCKNNSTVIFKYVSNKKINDFEMITSFIKYEKGKLYVWGYSQKYKDFSYLRIDKIKDFEIKEISSTKIYGCQIIRFEMYDSSYEIKENEVLVENKGNVRIIDYRSKSDFHSIQKFLEMGSDCKIISPLSFKNEFISVLKSIKEVYSNG